jgi:glycosyltransferase involved in cell wall biosynthesis
VSPNVTVLSEIPEEKLIELYGRCRGLIATSRDEPFGMNAVEAMASGKPVIAVKEGGYRETIVDDVTGALVDASEAGIIDGVKLIGRDPSKYRDACICQARKFDVAVFLRGIAGLIAPDPVKK